MLECHGNGPDHCCYINQQPCPHLQQHTMPGRRWVCGLLVKYGSWQAMNQSPEYQPIGEHWLTRGLRFNECELFDPGFCCRPEGRNGRRYPGHVPVDTADRYDGRYDWRT